MVSEEGQPAKGDRPFILVDRMYKALVIILLLTLAFCAAAPTRVCPGTARVIAIPDE